MSKIIHILIIGFIFLYSDVFTTIHNHSLFMINSCHTAFRLLAHVSLLQYRRSLNVLAFRRTLAHISARYACISSTWTQWVKNNKRANYSHELKWVFAWPGSYYSNHPWSFFIFMGNHVGHDILASLTYFHFISIYIYIYI